MLLARQGHKVLLLDRDTFPSDIMSTHFIHLPGKMRLHRWGLLDEVMASGVPPIAVSHLHAGEMELVPPRPEMPDGITADAICPRRYILDNILVKAAVGAGAELREGMSVRDLIWEDDRVVGIRAQAKDQPSIEERAKLVIGADGLHSVVARNVKPEEYDTIPSLTFAYYTYWTGVTDPDMHIYFFDDKRGILIFPTHDGKVCIGVGGDISGYSEFKRDIEGNYMTIIDRVPSLSAAIRAGKREERWMGTCDQPNYFRKPYGPGWALVGDAGYHRDFLTGLGITDAFRDAEYVAEAAHEGLSGTRPMEEAMASYQLKRDAVAKPLYDFTTKMAGGTPPEPMDWLTFGAAMAQMMNS
jgi:flavin-dependent dehydrogenase